jgi:hypothetical protein
MAFVQSVTGKTADANSGLESRLLETLPSNEPVTLVRPSDVLPAARVTSTSHSDMRDEIRRRVAAFRDRQQHFDRDRDEYCNATMAKARAASKLAIEESDNRRPKR